MMFKDDLRSNSPFSGKVLPNLENALNHASPHKNLQCERSKRFNPNLPDALEDASRRPSLLY